MSPFSIYIYWPLQSKGSALKAFVQKLSHVILNLYEHTFIILILYTLVLLCDFVIDCMYIFFRGEDCRVPSYRAASGRETPS